MFTKGNFVYAEAYKYLRSKNGRVIALHCVGHPEDFDEVDMTLPITIEIEGGMIFWEGRKLAARPPKFEYAPIKEHIVKCRYTNDEQIAIMLNKEKSEKDAILYEKMQEWRDFAATIATLATTTVKR